MGDTHNIIPWVEKYRPTDFEDIVLDPYNYKIMKNIIKGNNFPNLLLYGPPGTGKTTTIINLISDYQKENNQVNKELIIHLNASDERGIDIIRNHISQFVNSKTLFNKGTKFVILDEVDSMTKNAQYALKYLLQGFNQDVRFCLICNYISRIDESLQNEFLRLRFNQLPKNKIFKFLSHIKESEKLSFSKTEIESIQCLYKSDIRSMINYMQSNHNIKNNKIIVNKTWNEMIEYIQKNSVDDIYQYINKISNKYCIESKDLINDFVNYIIRYHPNYVNKDFLNSCEIIMHYQDINIKYYKKFFINEVKRTLHI